MMTEIKLIQDTEDAVGGGGGIAAADGYAQWLIQLEQRLLCTATCSQPHSCRERMP